MCIRQTTDFLVRTYHRYFTVKDAEREAALQAAQAAVQEARAANLRNKRAGDALFLEMDTLGKIIRNHKQ